MKMSEQIKYKKKRLELLLKWIASKRRPIKKFEMYEWLFDNYALGEKTREKDVRDLILFRFLVPQGNGFYVNQKKRLIW